MITGNSHDYDPRSNDDICEECGGDGNDAGCETDCPYYAANPPADDWTLVVACLSPTKRTIEISPWAQRPARLLGDGFGNLSSQIDDGNEWAEDALWDWSHLRDSSPEAIAACAAYLRSTLQAASRPGVSS